MMRKLLILAICLLVLAPQQFCTCGAGESPCTDGACPLMEPAHECDHHDTDGLIDADDDDREHPIAPTHQHRDPHHPGCPAVSAELRWTTPRSTLTDAPLITAGADADVVDDCPTPCLPRPERPSVLGPPHVPLFMFLLVLRN